MKITVITDKNGWLIESKLWEYVVHTLEDHDVEWCHSPDKIRQGNILFALHCYELIPKNKMMYHINNIVIHPSDLPKGRGRSPASWQVEQGVNKIPITMFEMGEKADNGGWYLKDFIPLDGTELIDDIREKIVITECQMIDKYLQQCPMKPQPQIGKPTYFPKRTPQDQRINITSEQFNRMRVADNDRYPIWFNYCGQKYILKITKEEDWRDGFDEPLESAELTDLLMAQHEMHTNNIT